MGRRIIGFVAVVQFILFLTHLFLYETWAFSLAADGQRVALWFKLTVALLSNGAFGGAKDKLACELGRA